MSSKAIPPFDASTVEAVSAILGETQQGLTNAEIEKILNAKGVRDPVAEARAANPLVAQGLVYVSLSKRDRIARAILNNQAKTNTGNALVGFIIEAMKPARYVNNPQRHQWFQSRLNEVLILEALKVTDEGQVAKTSKKAETLSEAAQLAGMLMTELGRRRAHDQVFVYCSEEIIAKDAFHAVHEAVKGTCERLRGMSGLTADGHELIDQALGKDRKSAPMLRLNDLNSDTDWNDQLGLAQLIRGLWTRYRNPTAHEARVVREAERPIRERELLEVLTSISLVHHALDTLKTSDETE